MRAADTHEAKSRDLVDAEGEGKALVLHHHGAPAGELPGGDLRQGRTIHADCALRGRQLTGQQLEQSRFAGAVGADDDRGRTLFERQRGAAHERAAADGEGEIVRFEDRSHVSELRDPAAAQQQPEEEGCADEGGDDADRQFGRDDDEAGDDVGADQQRRAADRRERQQQAVIGADREPDQMRHDDADEADHAGRGDAGTDRERDEQDRERLDALDRDAEMIGLGLAEHERIEPARQQRHGEKQRQHDRRHHRELGPAGAAEAAEATDAHDHEGVGYDGEVPLD
eukprot:gene34701-44496_t